MTWAAGVLAPQHSPEDTFLLRLLFYPLSMGSFQTFGLYSSELSVAIHGSYIEKEPVLDGPWGYQENLEL